MSIPLPIDRHWGILTPWTVVPGPGVLETHLYPAPRQVVKALWTVRAQQPKLSDILDRRATLWGIKCPPCVASLDEVGFVFVFVFVLPQVRSSELSFILSPYSGRDLRGQKDLSRVTLPRVFKLQSSSEYGPSTHFHRVLILITCKAVNDCSVQTSQMIL